ALITPQPLITTLTYSHPYSHSRRSSCGGRLWRRTGRLSRSSCHPDWSGQRLQALSAQRRDLGTIRTRQINTVTRVAPEFFPQRRQISTISRRVVLSSVYSRGLQSGHFPHLRHSSVRQAAAA